MNPTNSETLRPSAELRDWLNQAVIVGDSDLHLIAGYPPVLRLHGDLVEMSPC